MFSHLIKEPVKEGEVPYTILYPDMPTSWEEMQKSCQTFSKPSAHNQNTDNLLLVLLLFQNEGFQILLPFSHTYEHLLELGILCLKIFDDLIGRHFC